jgi:hypothetical protein
MDLSWFREAFRNVRFEQCSNPLRDFNLLNEMLSTYRLRVGRPDGVLSRELRASDIDLVCWEAKWEMSTRCFSILHVRSSSVEVIVALSRISGMYELLNRGRLSSKFGT